jgi:hypothetical protein
MPLELSRKEDLPMGKLQGVYLSMLPITFPENLFCKQKPVWNLSHLQYRYGDSCQIAITTNKSEVNSRISV